MAYLEGTRSDFPYNNKVDKVLELFNLPNSQRNNALEFQQLKRKDSLTSTEESRLAELAERLQHYIIDVEKWNFFGDVIVNMQTHYLNETVGFIDELQEKANRHLSNTEDFMTALKNSTTNYVDDKHLEIQSEVDRITYRGTWSPAVTYYPSNIVSIDGNGYIAKEENKNQVPSENSMIWGKITQKGDKGDPSLNINYKGEYQPSKAYVEGDAVTFGQYWYYTKKATQGNSPTNVEFWELQTNQTAVGDVRPFDSRINLWIDTQHKSVLKTYNSELEEYAGVYARGIVNEDGTKEVTPDLFDVVRQKAELIPANPKFTDTIYTHPATHPASMIEETTSKKFVSSTQINSWNNAMDKNGGQFTGVVKAHPNTQFTTAQVRNIILSEVDADVNAMNEGDIWIKYE